MKPTRTIMSSKNLWDLLSKASLDDHKVEELHNNLQKVSRYPMQELTIEAGPSGWVIHVHSADDSINELKIFIPQSHKEPVQIRETIEQKQLFTRTAELKL